MGRLERSFDLNGEGNWVLEVGIGVGRFGERTAILKLKGLLMTGGKRPSGPRL